ncbi:MAG: bifunctional (p)ppGpp synthetase/guanosine-3',5'-bis(diphosphate) 3'-pyrophosphohydrolase [Peptococcaceae bacterium]|nr:bifunctional (p)ppGpp synthetase/guanosine-3',5'-bis(diphosphate) 3'-pyrophosphohydrolase [Peptococcaceae bacterium]
MPYKQLIDTIRTYNPQVNEELLYEALHYAAEAHCNQKRRSGEDYISHPLAVAQILADLELDQETIMGAFLHDAVEDGGIDLETIKEKFGNEVALLVDGVTKLNRLEYRSKEEQQAENLRKMLLAMAKDIRVILIKLADRLHNMRTLDFHSASKRKEIAQETLEIYSPLAHRLGIYRIKWELEDLAFRHKNPDKYYTLAKEIAQTRSKREELINEAIQIIQDKIKAMGIKAKIEGRPKNLYSIYNKMVTQGKDLNEIYDVMGIRVIVDTIRDCYAALGVIHTLWTPVPGRFKDFIAMPKSNMYQSIHTTVVGPRGDLLEVQIRTWDMHRTAEYGIAAHWKYKAGARTDKEFDAKLAWLRQLLEWQHELRDAREFMESLKIDLFADVVFVFTPQGDVIELPAGSVPLDFAYRIHTEIGHRCIGAKVNGRLVPLDYKLHNGDRIEIITSKQSNPSRDWLTLVKTSQAKTKIRSWFRREQREENIARGRESLEREAKKQGIDNELLRSEKMLDIAKRYSFQTLDDLYAAIGLGSMTASAVITKLKNQIPGQEKIPEVVSDPKKWSKTAAGIRVKGIENVLVRLAHCCNPVPGDAIVGYITRGRGISVHRTDCRNAKSWQNKEPERLVEVAWDQSYNAPFQVKIEVIGMDRPGLLGDVMNVLGEMKVSANHVTARGHKSRYASIDLLIETGTLDQLNYLMQKLHKVRDVFEVKRVI